MDTRATAIDTAKRFVSECGKEGIVFDEVLLFGSYATGKAHEWSDIDLLLVSKNFTRNGLHNLKQYLSVNARFPNIETHPYPADYYLQSDAFLQSVLKDAVRIV